MITSKRTRLWIYFLLLVISLAVRTYNYTAIDHESFASLVSGPAAWATVVFILVVSVASFELYKIGSIRKVLASGYFLVADLVILALLSIGMIGLPDVNLSSLNWYQITNVGAFWAAVVVGFISFGMFARKRKLGIFWATGD